MTYPQGIFSYIRADTVRGSQPTYAIWAFAHLPNSVHRRSNVSQDVVLNDPPASLSVTSPAHPISAKFSLKFLLTCSTRSRSLGLTDTARHVTGCQLTQATRVQLGYDSLKQRGLNCV